jgi:predicted DNA repair protein MutK
LRNYNGNAALDWGANFINRKDKIKSAIVTDFISSVEIVIIALGTVLDQPILKQVPCGYIYCYFNTVGVYGIVAVIVRMDDLGTSLLTRKVVFLSQLATYWFRLYLKSSKHLPL